MKFKSFETDPACRWKISLAITNVFFCLHNIYLWIYLILLFWTGAFPACYKTTSKQSELSKTNSFLESDSKKHCQSRKKGSAQVLILHLLFPQDSDYRTFQPICCLLWKTPPIFFYGKPPAQCDSKIHPTISQWYQHLLTGYGVPDAASLSQLLVSYHSDFQTTVWDHLLKINS